MGATVGGGFDWATHDAQAEALTERLRRAPDPPVVAAPAAAVPAGAAEELAAAPLTPVAVPAGVAEAAGPPAAAAAAAGAGTWTLQRLQATFPWLAGYRSLSGVWRAVRRRGQRLRRGRPRQFSPDPDYLVKEAHLLAVLRRVAAAAGRQVVLFADEFTYRHWPLAGRTWGPGVGPAPVAERAGSGEHQRRVVAGLDGVSGQVVSRQANTISVHTLIAFLRQVARTYPAAETVYVVLDNWPVHHNAKVLAALAKLKRVEVVYLPTYSPWLNPIEKLWDWLKDEELRQHGLAGQWAALKARVTAFLAQFADGSVELLRRVGLLGEGKLASALRPVPITQLDRQT